MAQQLQGIIWYKKNLSTTLRRATNSATALRV